MLIKLILLAVLLLGLALAGIAIKMFFLKGSQFKKTCSSAVPGREVSCSCGGGDETQCENYEKHHGTQA